MSVYGYVRVSTEDQALGGHSLEAQQRAIADLCDRHGLALDGVYVEGGVSGKVPFRERPEGRRLWEVLKRGDTVIAVKLDRLSRNSLDALATINALAGMGVGLRLIDVPADPTQGGDGLFLATIFAALAHREVELIAGRTQAGMSELRAKGKHQGGRPPFGFSVGEDGELVPIPGAAEAVARMREMHAAGKSYRAIAAAVSAETPFTVSHTMVGRILTEQREPEGADA